MLFATNHDKKGTKRKRNYMVGRTWSVNNETRMRKIKRQVFFFFFERRQVFFWFPIKRQVNTENSRRRKQPINNHSKEKLKSKCNQSK